LCLKASLDSFYGRENKEICMKKRIKKTDYFEQIKKKRKAKNIRGIYITRSGRVVVTVEKAKEKEKISPGNCPDPIKLTFYSDLGAGVGKCKLSVFLYGGQLWSL